MKDCYLKARAYVNWLELKERIEKEGHLKFHTIEEAYRELWGHNFDADNKEFDCNINSICVTVKQNENGFTIDSNGIGVWDDHHSVCIGIFSADELKKYIVED